MKGKVISVLTVSLVSLLLLMAFSVNMSAEEGDPPELDNDKNIYFMENEEVENYYYNYSSDIYSYTTTVGGGSWMGPDFVFDNQIHLTAMVQHVTGAGEDNTIRIFVVAQGAYELSDDSFGDPSQENVDYAGTTHVPIEAEVADIEGGDQEQIEGIEIKSNTATGDNITVQDEDSV